MKKTKDFTIQKKNASVFMERMDDDSIFLSIDGEPYSINTNTAQLPSSSGRRKGSFILVNNE